MEPETAWRPWVTTSTQDRKPQLETPRESNYERASAKTNPTPNTAGFNTGHQATHRGILREWLTTEVGRHLDNFMQEKSRGQTRDQHYIVTAASRLLEVLRVVMEYHIILLPQESEREEARNRITMLVEHARQLLHISDGAIQQQTIDKRRNKVLKEQTRNKPKRKEFKPPRPSHNRLGLPGHPVRPETLLEPIKQLAASAVARNREQATRSSTSSGQQQET